MKGSEAVENGHYLPGGLITAMGRTRPTASGTRRESTFLRSVQCWSGELDYLRFLTSKYW